MPDQDFNCYDPHANPGGQTPPPHWLMYMCEWKGKLPKSFTGTWRVTHFAESGLCDQFPSGEQQVTWNRITKDCEDLAIYNPPMDTPNYTIPFTLTIFDPLVPEYMPLTDQARQLVVQGSAYALGGVITSSNCSSESFSMSMDWNNGPCTFSMAITGVSF